MRQAFEAQAEHAERNLTFKECRQCLAQARSHQRGAGHVGDFVDATGKLRAFAGMIAARGGLQLLKRFDSADDGTMPVVNGNSADADRNFISGFVVQKAGGIDGVRCFHGAVDRAVLAAEFATRLIAVEQRFRNTGVADDFVAQVAGDALRPIAPEHNSLLHVDHAEASRQAFEDAATDLWVVK